MACLYPLGHDVILSSRFRRFLAVGGLCTALDFGLFFLLVESIGLPIAYANLISYGSGLVIAFFINRLWTFQDSQYRAHRRVLLALLSGYAGLLLNTLIVWYLAGMMSLLLAKIIAVVVVLFYNYAMNTWVVFRIPIPQDSHEDTAISDR